GLQILGGAFDAARQVDRVSQRAVFELAMRTDVPDLRRPAAHPDAKAHPLLGLGHPTLIQLRQSSNHGEGCPTRTLSMVELFLGSAPHGQRSIAREIDNDSSMVDNAVRDMAHHVPDPVNRPRRPQSFGDAAGAANIADEASDIFLSSI